MTNAQKQVESFRDCYLSRHESALPAEPLPATPENRELVEMIVKESRLPSNQCQSGNDDASGRRPSTGWQRTGSEVSLASFDNDPDQESLKR